MKTQALTKRCPLAFVADRQRRLVAEQELGRALERQLAALCAPSAAANATAFPAAAERETRDAAAISAATARIEWPSTALSMDTPDAPAPPLMPWCLGTMRAALRWRHRSIANRQPARSTALAAGAAHAAPDHSAPAAAARALERLDKVTWCGEDTEVPAGCVGVVQGVAPDGRVCVEWLSGTTRTHGREELARRADIGFEGAIVKGSHGDQGTYCTVSFPGKEALQWEALVQQADGGGLSTACVFLIKSDARNGAHSVDPEHPAGKCFCHALYGEQKDWGYVTLAHLSMPLCKP